MAPDATLPLGYHPVTRRAFAAREVDRFSGTYVLGVAGSGKSGELQNLILADAAKGHSVIVIDPHGDLVDNCLATLPPHRLRDTYVLDMLDEGYPFGINLFGLAGRPQSAREQSQAVDRVMHVLEVLWSDVLTQQYLPNYVRTATIALINTPGLTLLDMHRFLLDKSFRDGVLRAVPDPMVHAFWREHDALKPAAQTARIQSLLNKLGAIFIGRDLIQRIMGQPTTISFRKAVERREIVFIKLPINQLEQDAKLLGAVILAQISAALFSFADLPERERPGFSLYVDEFQNFATPDFARMFTEGRKFGMRVTLAHQLRGQLPDYLQDATASARTKICFQLKADDAREMAQYFPPPGGLSEVEAHATAALLKDPGSDEYVRALTTHYLRPLQAHKKGGKVRIERQGIGLGSVLWLGYDEAKKQTKKAEPIELEDPTQYLDDLLRDVMQSGVATLDIPYKVVLGFSCLGFYDQARGLKSSLPLTGGYVFPTLPHTPHSGQERLLHFLFTLRMAMRHFATHPLGKKAEGTNAAVAQLLTQLPRRQALARSGDEVGRIATYDTPAPLTGQAIQERIALLRDQTRAKYCHAREAVEQRLTVETREPVREPVAVGRVAVRGAFGQFGEIAGWGEIGEP
jgi:hypothetical protein